MTSMLKSLSSRKEIHTEVHSEGTPRALSQRGLDLNMLAYNPYIQLKLTASAYVSTQHLHTEG